MPETSEPRRSPESAGAVSGISPSTSPTVNYATVSGEGGAQESVGQCISDHLAIDRRLNAIVLTGTPAEIAGYEAIVDAIDVPLRSVMLQTEIVELTDTAARNVGIDFGNGSGNGQIASATFVTPNPNQNGTSNSPNQISLQAAIYAQVQKGNGRIIATPRILALDGKPASILTGDALPIITSIAVSGVNAVQQQVEYVNVGVDLQILARSTADGHVTAQVFSAVSSVTGFTSWYPNIAQRQASTTVTVRDGQSFGAWWFAGTQRAEQPLEDPDTRRYPADRRPLSRASRSVVDRQPLHRRHAADRRARRSVPVETAVSARFANVKSLVPALLLACAAPALADGIPPGGQEPTRPVALPRVPGAPVVIDSAYVDVVSGATGHHDDVNVSCVRYRNVAAEPIVAVRSSARIFDGSRSRLGSDSVEDRTKRKPNKDARPGTVPLADAYWDCTHRRNPYGAAMQSVSIAPIFVQFASGKTWQLR